MLTIKEFFDNSICMARSDDKSYKQKLMAYADRITEDNNQFVETLRYGFILWNVDEAPGWGGPWCETGVLFTVKDYSGSCNIRSTAEIKDSWLSYAKHSVFDIPTGMLRKELAKANIGRITAKERILLLTTLTAEEVIAYENHCKNHAEQLFNNNPEPSIEFPTKIYLCGTDDASYTAVFSTRENALKALYTIDNNPMMNTIKSLGFMFSN